MTTRDAIDWIWNNLLTLGRGTNAIALKTPGSGLLEVRTSSDSDYTDFRARDIRLRNLFWEGYQAGSRVIVPRRQCVLAGQMTGGLPSCISHPGSLTAQINASATQPLVLAFAAGFDQLGGAIDYVVSHTSNVGFGSIPANTTQYFYADRSAGGALTFNRTDIAPRYSRVAPASPATGQHWFNTAPTINTTGQTGMTMYEWAGSWVPRQRVFLGEITYNASTATNTATYAYQRRYLSNWTTAASGTNVNFAHNLGMTPAEGEALALTYARANSSDAIHQMAPGYYSEGGVAYGVYNNYVANPRLNHFVYLGGGGVYFGSGGWVTSGEIQFVLSSQW